MRVDVGGARLFVDFDGAKLRPEGPWLAEAPTVVIVHTGPGADHTPYKDHVGPALAGTSQVVYVDLRGCGRSDESTPEHWNTTTWSDDLRTLFDVLGIERPVLLGAGWGAYTALRFAARWPGEVGKLVLANPTARLVVPRVVARFDELGGATAGEAAHNFLERPDELTVGAYLRECFAVMVAREHAVALLIQPRWNLDLAIHWTANEARTLDLRDELGAVDAPTLVIAGTDDPQYPRASIEEVVEGLRDPTVEWYEGARHSVFRDAPVCLDVIREFVAG
jgi:proline iminopeptidase